MTPLALALARKALGGPGEDWGNLASAISSDLHCFDVSAIGKSVADAMDADNLWPDMVSMLPRLFLPSPVTWLEANFDSKTGPFAYVIRDGGGGWFDLSMAINRAGVFTLRLCRFRGCTVLENPERIEIELTGDVLNDRLDTPLELTAAASPYYTPTPSLKAAVSEIDARVKRLSFQAESRRKDIDSAETAIDLLTEGSVKFGITWAVLALDLINTPGLVGLRQHDPHRGMAKRFAANRAGSYPLHGWSEVVLKHQTKVADGHERLSGTTFHKCLHFVRSHLRHYQNGKVVVIPAHWRGDPALGIKRTRYRLAA